MPFVLVRSQSQLNPIAKQPTLRANPSKGKSWIVDCLVSPLLCLCYNESNRSSRFRESPISHERCPAPFNPISLERYLVPCAFLTVVSPLPLIQRRHHDDQVHHRSLYPFSCHDGHQRPAWWTPRWWWWRWRWPPSPRLRWPTPRPGWSPPRWPLQRRQFCRPV